MKNKILMALFCLCVGAAGVFFLMQKPLDLFDKVAGLVLLLLAFAGAFKTPFHESVETVSQETPLLARAMGGFFRLCRRETDTVVTPTDPPAGGAG